MGKDLPIDTQRAERTREPVRGPPGNGPGPRAARADPMDRHAFWAEKARRIDWIEPFTTVATERFDPAEPVVRWFEDGTLNVCHNCLDRHAALEPDRPALVWDAIDPAESRSYTRGELLAAVSRFANVLKAHSVVKGEAVAIFLPTAPEAVIAMLACARIGAIHTVIFVGYSGKALAARIRDCNARILVTADAVPGEAGPNPLKAKVDVAASLAPSLEKVIVVRRAGIPVDMQPGRDAWFHAVVEAVSDRCPPKEMSAEAPLFIAYTLGVSGRPKGIVHASAGYLVHVCETLEAVLGGGAGTLVWCTADISHAAAHAYAVYGPLANGGATLLSEALQTAIDGRAHLDLLARHRVDVYYTTPAIAREVAAGLSGPVLGQQSVDQDGTVHAPRTIASFGEALADDVERFLEDVVGRGRARVIDTWWQTESGGILLASGAASAQAPGEPVPRRVPDGPLVAESGVEQHEAGCIGRPIEGVALSLIDRDGRRLQGTAEGELVMTASWPGQARTIFGDHLRFAHTYFGRHAGICRSGDSAVRFADGSYHVFGRLDEILHLAGHRVPADEIEHAIGDHRQVAEVAVVQLPRVAASGRLCAFLVLAGEVADRAALEADLSGIVRTRIGEFAVPAIYQPVRALPRARSGRVVRRILKQIAAGTYGRTDDTLTLVDPGVVEALKLEAKGLVLPN